jgi:hypothetical protein
MGLAKLLGAYFVKPCLGTMLLAFMIAQPQGADAADQQIVVGAFSQGSMAGWDLKAFKGETDYSLVYDPEKRSTVLHAVSRAAASGRFRKMNVDLTKTPYLNWSWKVSEAQVGLDETVKAGDDFPARVFVVVERGIMGLSTLSVNYVWASQHPTGSAWPSPFTSHVRLLAVDSGSKWLNTWVTHKRNVRADLREQFGEDIVSVDAVALMTDTDNSGGRAQAYYGDIWFSAE